MPELPEVEMVARGLREPLTGRRVTGLWSDWPRVMHSPQPEEFAARIDGQVFRSIERRGKYLLCALDSETLIVHLRMTGRLYVAADGERFEADRKALARRIRPSSGEWSWDGLDALVAQLGSFQSGAVESWPTEDHRFRAALKRVPPERIDRLALYAPEDSVNVHFKGRDGRWRPLTHGSPGQQTAALLAFVLGVGSEPIVLDQPEDDLDNTLIYDLLVSQLKETKLRRQVIVVTHNPNIVVHGDAELVLSLEAAGGQTRIACEGGLQQEKVRDEICEIMEGGSEAFARRYRRIMPGQGRGA